MNLGITQQDFILFLLVFTRVTTAFVIFPVFNSSMIPIQAKIGGALFITLLLLPLINHNIKITPPPDMTHIIFSISREVLVGLILGFLSSLIFIAIEIAGQLMSMQMGFGIVNVYDPDSNQQVPVVGQFYMLLSLMIFLAIDGHLFLLEGLNKSFAVVPLMRSNFHSALTEMFVTIGGGLFISAIKIGIPVIVTLTLTNIALGLVARAVPQMNVFFVGMPLNIGMGLLAMAFSLPLFAYLFRNIYVHFQNDFFKVLQILSR